jgi:ATP-dependent Lon protease
VKTVFIPKANLPDLDEVDAKVKENIEFVPVEYVGGIIDKALLPLETDLKEEWKIGNEVVVSNSVRPTLR